jgi:rhodanese-related sulfurtransferase
MTSQPNITPQSTMRAVLDAFPWAQRALFRHYHIGGCASCAFDLDEDLKALCLRNENLDPEEVLLRIQESHNEDSKVMMTPQAVSETLQSGETCRLVDIRTSEEWEAVKLQGAVHMSQESMQEMLSQWPREDLLVIYDHTGQHSLDAATYFQGQGFSNVRCLAGGIDAWSREINASVPRYRLESAKT